nr:helix-turn-helix domain-containing protein [Bradyrhizobium liaoningense]
MKTLTAGSILEAAFVGCQGAVDLSVALQAGETPVHRSIVLVAGTALRIRTGDLQNVIRERPQIREHLLHHIKSLVIHCSQTALCGVRHSLEQRLACWLSLVCEALDSDNIAITHCHISMNLGFRRAGITEALARFEQQGLLRKTRGMLQVRDRRSLQDRACGCYEVIAQAYDCAGLRKSVISEVQRQRHSHFGDGELRL